MGLDIPFLFPSDTPRLWGGRAGDGGGVGGGTVARAHGRAGCRTRWEHHVTEHGLGPGFLGPVWLGVCKELGSLRHVAAVQADR